MGHKLTAVRPTGNGRHEPLFVDGNSVAADLLVGADGAWSKVRPLVSDARPVYSGTCFIEIALAARDMHHAVIGAGTLTAPAPGRGIITHRNADGSVAGYVALDESQEWVRALDCSDTRAGLKFIGEQFTGWASTLTGFIEGSIADPTLRPIHALPVGHEWSRTVGGATLVSDAAHLMSPFAGERANLAMFGGAELARRARREPGRHASRPGRL